MTDCVCCDHQRECWQDPKAILRLFKTCKKHQEELEGSEMAQCAKCESQDMEFKEGIGKATGKPWKAWYCATCKLMHGMNGIPWGDKGKKTPQATYGQPARTPQQAILEHPKSSLDKKLDEILEILHDNFGQKPEYIKEDETPF